MLSLVWRVADRTLDVDAFVRRYGLSHALVWRRGESCRSGRASNLESGFNLSIDRDDDDLADALEDMRSFLRERHDALDALRQQGIRSTLDVGMTVGSNRHYTRSVRLPPEDLVELGRAGIDLQVSAYPCSEDDEPDRSCAHPTAPAAERRD